MPLKLVGDGEREASLVMVEEEGEIAPYRGVTGVVMMPWEKPYMEACVKALELSEDDEGVKVLEIGFGLGYSATAIQSYRVRKHVIVECEAEVVKVAREWAKGREGVVIVEGFWQHELPRLGSFSAIFYDDFPLPVPGVEEAQVLQGTGSRWHHFADLCISHHMRGPGSRLTGYLATDLDLSRPDCNYTRQPIQVEVSPDCPYAPPGTQTYYIPLLTLAEAPRIAGHIPSHRAQAEEDLIVSAHQGRRGSSKRARMLAHVLMATTSQHDD